MAKRLLGVGVIWPKDSLVPGLKQHQGVFWPDHPNNKESFDQITSQNFISHFPLPNIAFWSPPQKKQRKIVLVTKPDVADDETEVVSRKQLGVAAVAVDDWQLA